MDFRKVGLVCCPYNKTHWVKPGRMGSHIVNVHPKELAQAHKRTETSEEEPKIKMNLNSKKNEPIITNDGGEQWDDLEVETYKPPIFKFKNGRRNY